MKSDRELLELAARAAGIDGEYHDEEGILWFRGDATRFWNPLTNDGDALRLAVKLKFNVNVWTTRTTVDALDIDSVDEPHGTDPYAATRRAIVRASAKIGEGK